MESPFRGARHALLALMMLPIASGAARGDPADVFNVTVGHVETHDSNLFRLAPETNAQAVIGTSERADRSSQDTLQLRMDKQLGRQTLRLAMANSRVRYARSRQINSNLADVSATWDWAVGRLWTGQLKVGRADTAPGFSDYRAPVADRVTTDTTAARAVLMFHPDWRLALGATSTKATHSATVNATGNSRVDGTDIGLRYVGGAGKQMGVTVRHLDGRYPNRQVVGGLTVNNDYAEDGLDVDASWQASGASRLTGSLGQSKRRHNDVPGRNFSGATGNIAWDWQPTGKTGLGLAARREIGGQQDLIATYAVTDSLTARASWLPTAKLSLNASAEARRRALRGDPGAVLAGTPAQQDDYRITSISAGYAPLRDLQLSLALRRERRDSNTPGFSYRTDQVTASAQLTF